MTAEEARELVALAARAGVVHGVSFVYRQFAMVQQAAAMIRHGEVGRIFAAHGSYLQDWMLLETDYNWRVDSAQGGASPAGLSGGPPLWYAGRPSGTGMGAAARGPQGKPLLTAMF